MISKPDKPLFDPPRQSGARHPAGKPFMPTIALIDDDRNTLMSASSALEAEGYLINTYTDGPSVLDGFKTAPPDLIILDVEMPDMNWMQTSRRLRELNLPVIVLTATGQENELSRPCGRI